MDNSFLKDINSKINEKIQKNKEIFEQEQEKAKTLFNDFKHHSLVQYEDVKEHLQEHVNHFNSFSENLKNHLTNSPFDFNSFSKSLFEYNKKSFEIVSNATKKQTERISELNNKIHQFYKNEIKNYVEPVQKSTSDEVNKEAKKEAPVAKKTVRRKTVKKTTAE